MLIYGFGVDDLEEIRRRIESALPVKFQKHDSSFLGGDYYRAEGQNNEQFILFRNWDPVDEEPIQSPETCKTIIRIEQISAARAAELDTELRRFFQDITLLHK